MARAAPQHTAPWRLTPMQFGVLISVLLHLSMVTLFSIVIYFPRQDVAYYRFEIAATAPPAAAQDPADPPTAETSNLRLRDPLAGGSGEDISLPTIEFAELERLRISREADPEPPNYERLMTSAPEDSWGRFTGGLRALAERVGDLQLDDDDGDDAPAAPTQRDLRIRGERPAPAGPVHRPAEGYEAYLEWAGGEARELLYAPPVSALYDSDASAATWPIELVLDINPSGRVVNVWSPTVDAGPLLDELQLAVLRYRFAPADGDNAGVDARQMATLHIRPTRAAR